MPWSALLPFESFLLHHAMKEKWRTIWPSNVFASLECCMWSKGRWGEKQNIQICAHRNLVLWPPKRLPFRLKIIHLIWTWQKTDKMLSKYSSEWEHLSMLETVLLFCRSKSLCHHFLSFLFYDWTPL